MNKRPLTNYNQRRLLVAPSVLAANFAELAAEIHRVEQAGADVLHLDIMDGHFVPNLSMGPPVVKSLRTVTKLPFDVHLMLTHPLKYVESFAASGADHITFHLESESPVLETLAAIRACGCSVGLCVKPGTPATAVLPWLEKIDLVLVMTVEPGFGGQSFMANMTPKICELRRAIDNGPGPIHLEVDGGIDAKTVGAVAAAGANLIVAGTSVFRHPAGADAAIATLHAAQRELDQALAAN